MIKNSQPFGKKCQKTGDSRGGGGFFDSRCTGSPKTVPFCFTAHNFRNTGHIFTKFGTNQSHFTLNIIQ